ncbi:hypothetical protein AWRI1631_74650 [Saccharomyces cerevisiae AWRI1631]|uniref:Uncharacterized protein n=1 Tax=Saccharomyces cerevisiae (strain AWRI1631) TaxID=545124 RepID=B5VJI5_YEAS6|nr:hypothetical protein AWRI1631_74650 [Saccharomyces cerevisiae AWRI1631]
MLSRLPRLLPNLSLPSRPSNTFCNLSSRDCLYLIGPVSVLASTNSSRLSCLWIPIILATLSSLRNSCSLAKSAGVKIRVEAISRKAASGSISASSCSSFTSFSSSSSLSSKSESDSLPLALSFSSSLSSISTSYSLSLSMVTHSPSTSSSSLSTSTSQLASASSFSLSSPCSFFHLANSSIPAIP